MNRSLTAGALFVALGAAFLLDDLGVLTVQFAVLLPILLIVAGIALTMGAMEEYRR